MKVYAFIAVLCLMGAGFAITAPFDALEAQAGLVVGLPRTGDSVVYKVNTDGPQDPFSLLSTQPETQANLLSYYERPPVQTSTHIVHFTWDGRRSVVDQHQDEILAEFLLVESSGFITEYGYRDTETEPFMQRWVLETLEFTNSSNIIQDTARVTTYDYTAIDYNPPTSAIHCLARSEWQGVAFAAVGDHLPGCLRHLPIDTLKRDGTEEFGGFTTQRFTAGEGDEHVVVSFIPGLAYPARLLIAHGGLTTEFVLTGFEQGTGTEFERTRPAEQTPAGHPLYPTYPWGPRDDGVGLTLTPSEAYNVIMDHPDLEDFHRWRHESGATLYSYSVNLWGSSHHVESLTFLAADQTQARVTIWEQTYDPYQPLIGLGLMDRYNIRVGYSNGPAVEEVVNPSSLIKLQEALHRVDSLVLSRADNHSEYGSPHRLVITMGSVVEGEYQPATATATFSLVYQPEIVWNLENGETISDHFVSRQLLSLADLTTNLETIVNRIIEGDQTTRETQQTSGIAFDLAAPDQVVWTAKTAAVVLLLLPLVYAIPKLFAFLHTRFLPQGSLKLPNRQRIHEAIRLQPGICTEELRQQTGFSMGTVLYHLKILESDRHVIRLASGNYTRYFPQGYGPKAELQKMAIELDAGAEHRVFNIICNTPGVHAAELARILRISRPAVLETVGRLEKRDLLNKQKDGKRLRLYPKHVSLTEPGPRPHAAQEMVSTTV